VACNLRKIATVNLSDLEAALDLIGEMVMPVPDNKALDYFESLDPDFLMGCSIKEIIRMAYVEAWSAHEQWISEDIERVHTG
jgi:hypothetical protein